jgi:hypothetical protein
MTKARQYAVCVACNVCSMGMMDGNIFHTSGACMPGGTCVRICCMHGMGAGGAFRINGSLFVGRTECITGRQLLGNPLNVTGGVLVRQLLYS